MSKIKEKEEAKRKGGRLPQDLERWSDEEIARFFEEEENDPLGFLEETEPEEVKASRSASTMAQVNFRLPENALKALKRVARLMGIGHTTLIRLWVMEKLYERLTEDRHGEEG